MKKIILLTLICSFYLQSNAQVEYSDSTKYYSFEINYYLNLHHFLWLEAFYNVNADSSIIERTLPRKSKEILDRAIDYYKRELISKDLRSSDYMTDFKHWITKQKGQLVDIPRQFNQHLKVLNNVNETYKEHFWASHKSACINVLEENIQLIRQTEKAFVDSITVLTRQFWQFEKLKVDITYSGKVTKWNMRNRPYTSIFPTHVVMNVFGENEIKGNWLEVLYHESAHHLILGSSYFVGGTIKNVAEVIRVKPPRELGHSYLFYFTGELTEYLLNEIGIPYDKIYMVRNGVFSKYYPFLETHLKEYMKNKITLAKATELIIRDLH